MAARHFIARDDLISYQQALEQYGIPIRTLKHLAETGQIAYETTSVGRRPSRKFRRSVVMTLMAVHEPKSLDGVQSRSTILVDTNSR